MSNKKEFSVRPFEKLKKTIERSEPAALPSPAHSKKKEEFTDEELFTTEMDDVREIEAYRALPCVQPHPRERAAAERVDPDREAIAILDEIATGVRPMHLPDTQEYVEWTHPDYFTAIIPKLHEGRFSVQASIDLHGCSVPEAEAELDDFLQEANKKGFVCVKIIHGRGLRSLKGPRIKAAVIKRLSGHYRKDIIAYVTARQCDGGLGALYVLLRK